MSLETVLVPKNFKQALVRPLLKKNNLNADDLKSYRPVSNLSFVSKQLERVVATRLSEHLYENNLCEALQSAYKSNHRTETALLHVSNDILWAMDDGKVGVLVLLDLSAAFDTVDHSLLIQRLQKEVGLTGTALSWFRSYLENRCQGVIIQGEVSSEQQLCFGMPLGSVLGPRLFSVYMTPLSRIIRKHGLNYHFYADDSQLYIFVKPVQILVDIAASRMQRCIEDIRIWMRANFLKCNGDKTEILLIGSKRHTASISLDGITIGNAVISPSAAARNLGVIFDSKMSL